jgi:AraC family transcriptional regulator
MQSHLDQDLPLDLLADEAGLSKFHFHKLFCRLTGETPKAYVDRLRLERAAIQLRIRQSPILEIALECGYRNHETFTRAFRAHFAMSPRDYRQQWSRQANDHRRTRLKLATTAENHAQLSATRVVRLARVLVAFIRHIGRYERVAASHFHRLTAWARRHGIGGEAPLLLGIAHDAPGITPPDKMRFDCCIQVPEVFDVDGNIACQRTPAGDYALTDYVGSWNLGPAYRTIVDRLRSDATLQIIGLPAIEIYRKTRIGQRHGLAHMTIAIPVKPRPRLTR